MNPTRQTPDGASRRQPESATAADRRRRALVTRAAIVLGLGLLPTATAATAADRRDGFDRALLPRPVVDGDFHDDGAPPEARVELGRLLFFDKILSGNRNISCATCHHPRHATGDAVALPLGEGASGLGPRRRAGTDPATAVHARVPRNSPALFNLGAREYTRMFFDGRVELDTEGYYASGFITPAKWKLPNGLDNVLAAQAMFPVSSFDEMAGQKGENPVADARSLNNAAGPGGVWQRLAERLRGLPEYVERFRAAFPERVRDADDITYVEAANAIAAFETVAFRADDSPFDRFLRGDRESLDRRQRRGMRLFYGRAGCARCHAGAFQTDHRFHAIAMPQIGPGKGDGRDAEYWQATGHRAFLEDFGRGRVTVRAEDRFRFRTPSLRNVALTAPYGHAGAYGTLEEVVRHHLDPAAALAAFDADAVELQPLARVPELTVSGSSLRASWLTGHRLDGYLLRDTWVQKNKRLRGRIAAANELPPNRLEDREVTDLLAFLDSLTDPASRDLTRWIPESVPSGLPVAD